MVGFHGVRALGSGTVKYEVLINSAKIMMEKRKMYNRSKIISENKEFKEQLKINYAG